MSRKKCVNCMGSVDTAKDKYVLVGTYNGTGQAKHDEQFFHFECWREYFRGCVTNKIQKGINQTLGMVRKMSSQLSGDVETEFKIKNEIPTIDLQVQGVENLWKTEKKKKKKVKKAE